MAKFTTNDISILKTGKTEFNKMAKKIQSNPIFKSPTVKFFNTRGKLEVIRNFENQLRDFESLISEYRREFRDIVTTYSNLEFSAQSLSARGWHKDRNNYNKAEKHELPPSLRRTPARNVTKTGAKRKRATTVKKYKK